MTTKERKRLNKKWYPKVPDLTPHVRVRKGYRIVKRFKDLNPLSTPVEGGLRCLICQDPVQYLKSTSGKIMIGKGSLTSYSDLLLRDGGLVEVQDVRSFPIMKSGRACQKCKGKLTVVLPEVGLEGV